MSKNGAFCYAKSMKNILAILSGLVYVAGTIPYIVDTLRGKTKPNVVTWFTWGILSGVTAVAALAGHDAVQTAIFAGALAVTNLFIVVIGLRYGFKRYTKLDILCQVLAVTGIILWQITSRPELAILLCFISDFIGAVPTYRHIWLKPYEETLRTFVIFVISSAISIASLRTFGFVQLAYPLYILLDTGLIIALIVLRRRMRKG